MKVWCSPPRQLLLSGRTVVCRLLFSRPRSVLGIKDRGAAGGADHLLGLITPQSAWSIGRSSPGAERNAFESFFQRHSAKHSIRARTVSRHTDVRQRSRQAVWRHLPLQVGQKWIWRDCKNKQLQSMKFIPRLYVLFSLHVNPEASTWRTDHSWGVWRNSTYSQLLLHYSLPALRNYLFVMVELWLTKILGTPLRPVQWDSTTIHSPQNNH